MTGDFVYYVHKHLIPSALAFLPGTMSTPEARAMLLAIGFQESRFQFRRQLPNGPAHGFWQFERAGGVRAVLKQNAAIILPILDTLRYKPNELLVYDALVDNDLLACIFARLLLWNVRGALPKQHESEKGWRQYLEGWGPGKPHPATWPDFFNEAWQIVSTE